MGSGAGQRAVRYRRSEGSERSVSRTVLTAEVTALPPIYMSLSCPTPVLSRAADHVRLGLIAEDHGSDDDFRLGSKNEPAYAVVCGGGGHGLSGNGGALS